MSAEHTVECVECVESVESSKGLAQKLFKLLRSKEYIEALYSQIERREGGRVLRKLVTMADLKSCEKGVIYADSTCLHL